MNNTAHAILIVGLMAVTVHAYAVLDEIPTILAVVDFFGLVMAFLTWVRLDDSTNKRRWRLDEEKKELENRYLRLKIAKMERK